MEQRTQNTLCISAITPSSSSYPAELELTQKFVIDKTFSHTIIIKHLTGKAVPVNVGIHYYWDTPMGWGSATLNGNPLADKIKNNMYMDCKENNLIVFPHAQYELQLKGFHSAMFWTSFNTDEKGTKHYSQDFCCIEPIIKWPGYFGTEESILSPGKTISASIQIRKVV